MRLDKIYSSSSFSESGHDNRRQPKKNKKKPIASSKKSLLVDMNRVLKEKSYPYKIVEKGESLFYADINTCEIIRRVDEQFIASLIDKIAASSTMTSVSLTYEKERPSGDQLDLEI